MTPFTQEDVVRVAAGLSKAQREALTYGFVHYAMSISIATACVLYRLGLTERESYWSPLTTLGIQVKTFLQERRHHAD